MFLAYYRRYLTPSHPINTKHACYLFPSQVYLDLWSTVALTGGRLIRAVASGRRLTGKPAASAAAGIG